MQMKLRRYMGRAPSCAKCGGRVHVLAVMVDGKVDPNREARMCPKCGYVDKRDKLRRPRISR
jgi:hypothetical protein